MRAWWRWRSELRRLRREAAEAHGRWIRARYAYQDTAVVFRGQPSAWFAAMDVMAERMNEYLALSEQVRRMEEVGPQ